MSAGRHGPKPLLIDLPNLNKEADYVVEKLSEANRTGMRWNDMAIVYRRYGIGEKMAAALARRGIPFQWQQDSKHSYAPAHDSVKLMTMHSSKGLEFPLVCIPAIGAQSNDLKEDELKDEARLLYVAVARASHELVMTHAGPSALAEKMHTALKVLQTV